MYDNYNEVIKFVDKLDDSFVLTGSEVIHIRNVHYLANTSFFKHSSYLYTEIRVLVDATSYHLDGDTVVKEEIQSLYLTLDTTEILKACKSEIAVLMLSDVKLVRRAARELYKYYMAA